jgi:hypothetical protein
MILKYPVPAVSSNDQAFCNISRHVLTPATATAGHAGNGDVWDDLRQVSSPDPGEPLLLQQRGYAEGYRFQALILGVSSSPVSIALLKVEHFRCTVEKEDKNFYYYLVTLNSLHTYCT